MVFAGMQKRAFSLCSNRGTWVMKYFSLSDAVMVTVLSFTSKRKQSRMAIEFFDAITFDAAVMWLYRAVEETLKFISLCVCFYVNLYLAQKYNKSMM